MKSLAVAALLGLSAFTSLTHGSEAGAGLKTYEAQYRATAMGLSTTAFRSLIRSDDTTYLLQNSLTLRVLGATVGGVMETSRFQWQNGDLTPQQYRYEQTGISGTTEQVTFNWDTSVAHSMVDDESWTLPLTVGELDKLSYSTRLGQQIADGGSQEFSYQIVDGDEIEPHLYRIVGEEVISTPAGNLNSVRIERIREPGSSRRTTVWLAKDWDYLLVRLEQVSSSGRLTELNLESATMEGEILSGF